MNEPETSVNQTEKAAAEWRKELQRRLSVNGPLSEARLQELRERRKIALASTKKVNQ